MYFSNIYMHHKSRRFVIEKVFNEILNRRVKNNLYRCFYTGNEREMNIYSPRGSFWNSVGGKKLHIPLPSEIATYSSDLLFGERPKITVENNKKMENRLNKIFVDNKIWQKLSMAGEISAVFGSVYLKVIIDKNLLLSPIVSVVSPDNAYPIFNKGVLTSICFLKEHDLQEGIARVFETYSKGKIETFVYLGDESSLGSKCSLNDFEFTRDIDEVFLLEENLFLATFIPNILPNLDGNFFEGRSDFSGVIGLFDALDEAYSSWIRDISLGKARLIVPFEYLGGSSNDLFSELGIDVGFNKRPKVFNFNKEDELYVAMDIDTEGKQVQPVMTQFDIRSTEHRETCLELLQRIISKCGYSPQSFGLNISGYSESGVALNIRERKSFLTKSKKENLWGEALVPFFEMLLAIDNIYFQGSLNRENDVKVNIEFSDSITYNATEVAEVIGTLKGSNGISTRTMVEKVHPSWSDAQVEKEVEDIKNEEVV